jgi:hypothetical protein
MKTLRQELQHRIEKHTLSEVLDRLADVVAETKPQSAPLEKLIKALEEAVRRALEIEAIEATQQPHQPEA